MSSNESNATKFLVRALSEGSSACDSYRSCESCTYAWPACAWCGTTSKCLPATEELVNTVTRSYEATREDLHVVYKHEEYQATYGTWSYFSLFEGDCGVWIYRPASCARVSQHCSRYSGCHRCTHVDGCGYCHTNNYEQAASGVCLPGTARSQIGMSSDRARCAIPPATSSWIFGNWTKVYKEDLWQSPCQERCPHEQQRLQKPQGTLTLGNSVLTMSYAPDLECSWVLTPEPWPKDQLLVVSMSMISKLSHFDVVRVHTVGANSSGREAGLNSSRIQPGTFLAHIGCNRDSRECTAQDKASNVFQADPVDEECCVRASTISVAEPVIISFESLPLGNRKPETKGAWRVEWYVGHRPDDGSPVADARGFTLWWLGLLVLLIPFGLIIWMLRRCRCCGARPLPVEGQAAVGAIGGSAGYPRQSAVTHVDLVVLEREVPECKPRIIGASLDEAVVCSVCLVTPSLGDQVRRLPCSHEFHKECIDVWLRKSVHCPLCRQQINVQSTPTGDGIGRRMSPPRFTPVVPASQIPSTSSPAGLHASAHASAGSDVDVVDV